MDIIDEAMRIKAAKKEESQEKVAKEKRLKAQYARWQSLYSQAFVAFRK